MNKSKQRQASGEVASGGLQLWCKPLKQLFLSLREIHRYGQVLKHCGVPLCTPEKSRALSDGAERSTKCFSDAFLRSHPPLHSVRAPSATLRQGSMGGPEESGKEMERMRWEDETEERLFSWLWKKPLHIPKWETTMESKPKHIIYCSPHVFSQAQSAI